MDVTTDPAVNQARTVAKEAPVTSSLFVRSKRPPLANDSAVIASTLEFSGNCEADCTVVRFAATFSVEKVVLAEPPGVLPAKVTRPLALIVAAAARTPLA